MWKKRSKGNAKVYTRDGCPNAIVENHLGVFFMGQQFATVNTAKHYADLWTDAYGSPS